MFIKKISVENFRTLENFSVEFNGYFTAISGKNNAGKSNVLRAMKTLLDSGLHFRIRGNSILGISNFNWKEEITSWKDDKKEDIKIEGLFEISKNADTEIHKFLTEMIFKDELQSNSSSDTIDLQLTFIKKQSNEEHYAVSINQTLLSDEYKKKELIKRLQVAEFLTFHNSTMNLYAPFDDTIDRVSDFISPADSDKINKKKEELLNIVKKGLKDHQQKLTGWLGKLEDKYEVCLSVQGLNFEKEPIDISLKEKGGDVILDNWGSGTRNRTLIFLKLFNAVNRAQKDSETDRIKPIFIIEEPESFLHPQAQAEFGRILQDLAEQLKIQIIITTHSPYFLSIKSPSNNILLERSKNGETILVKSEDENWWKPFVDALGIKSDDFGPMKEIIFNGNEKILMVEGPGDKRYLEYFQSDIHGENALRKDIEIVPMNGADALKNTVWINFLKKKFHHVGIMIDMDKEKAYLSSLESVGFKKNNNLFVAGTTDAPFIEGFVPLNIFQQVSYENPELSQKMLNPGNNQIQKEARSEMKTKILEKLENSSETEGFDKFYKLIKNINKFYAK